MSLFGESTIEIKEIHDKYRFKQKIGSGLFSDVFKAKNIETDIDVAVKILRIPFDAPTLQADKRVLRFRREMALNEKLNHPNIIKILEPGETETGILFIVFEYVDGVSLSRLIKKQGILSVKKTINIMTQILSGLAHAHDKGIIHRDLKPENIIVIQTESPELVKILDFGISTFTPQIWGLDTRITQTQEFLGTPSFAAPEQLRGDPVSTRTDLFSWGLIFLECLTGRTPLGDGNMAKVVQLQLSSTPVPIPSVIANHQLGVLLRWVLEKKPERRAAHCRHVLSRLESISVDDIPVNEGFLPDSFLRNNQVQPERIAIYKTLTSSRERRQVTVLCYSMTINLLHHSPAQEIIDEIYHDLTDLCHEKLKMFGGYISGNIGDRTMVYFGFPSADDSDTRRAVMAALELSSLFTRKNIILTDQCTFKLSYQIGIHTGMVTVRKKKGEKDSIIGLTPNIAGKLCESSHSGSTVLSETTFELVKGIVECEMVTPPSGLQESIKKMYRMIGEHRNEGLVMMAETDGIPLIGRKQEIRLLTDAIKVWREDQSGKVFLIQGEAGIGKSRLVAEAGIILQKDNTIMFECRCTSEGINCALFPIIDFIKGYFGLNGAKTHEALLRLLEKKLKNLNCDTALYTSLMGPWLGVPPNLYAPLKVSPPKQREMLIRQLTILFVTILKSNSAAIMFEDLHWADPTTLDLLSALIAEANKEGLFIMMSTRPVFVFPWEARSVEIIELHRMEDKEIEDLIIRNIHDRTLPREILVQMVGRVDGIPLFAKELALMAHEWITENRTPHGSISKILAKEIPETLRDLLTGRLDRMGQSKATAQLAATLGRVFSYDLIARIALRDEAALLSDLDQLVSAGLLYLRFRVNNPEYVFHHTLVRDIAYDSLPKKERIQLHCRIAEILEQEFTDIVKTQPEVLAHHWANAEMLEKAANYSLQAAATSISRSSYTETVNFVRESIGWVNKIDDEKKKNELEMNLNLFLYQALVATKGTNHPEVLATIKRSEELCVHYTEESQLAFSVLISLIMHFSIQPDRGKLKIYLDKGFSIAEKLQQKEYLSFLKLTKGNILFISGNFAGAIDCLNSACDLYDQITEFQLRSPGDIKVFSLSSLALLYSARGEITEATNAINRALDWADKLKHNYSKGMALANELGIWHYTGNKEMVKQRVEGCLIFMQNNDLMVPMIVTQVIKSWSEDDLDGMKQFFPMGEQIGFNLISSYWNSMYAQVEYANGRFLDARERCEFYIEYATKNNELFFLSELYRLKGLCVLRSTDDLETSRSCITNAVEIARRTGTKLFELRAMNELYKITDDKSKLHSELEQLVSRFNNEPECNDKKEADALLNK